MLITQLVPDAERFRVALRAVKLWAQGQGLYSNILGYLVTLNRIENLTDIIMISCLVMLIG